MSGRQSRRGQTHRQERGPEQPDMGGAGRGRMTPSTLMSLLDSATQNPKTLLFLIRGIRRSKKEKEMSGQRLDAQVWAGCPGEGACLLCGQLSGQCSMEGRGQRMKEQARCGQAKGDTGEETG